MPEGRCGSWAQAREMASTSQFLAILLAGKAGSLDWSLRTMNPSGNLLGMALKNPGGDRNY